MRALALVAVALLGVATTCPLATAVVGGSPARIEDYPYVAALVEHRWRAIDGQFCGGSVVAATWVLTATHCVVRERDGRPLRPSRIDVVVGRTRLARHVGERRRVAGIVRPSDDRLDLALLHLAAPVTAPPVTLAAPGTALAPGTPAAVLGWGETLPFDPKVDDEDADGHPAARLRVATLSVLDDARCARARDVGASRIADPRELCAGDFRRGGPDACAGDSGGPLVVATPAGPVQVGVVSWGDGCGLPGRPGVYARTARGSAWVRAIVARSDATGG
jgi:secreted trypsin-like serine protease